MLAPVITFNIDIMEIFRKIFTDKYEFTRARMSDFNINYLFALYSQYYPTDFIHDILTNTPGVSRPVCEYQANGLIVFKHNLRSKDFIIIKPSNYTPVKDENGNYLYLISEGGGLHQKTFKDIILGRGWKAGVNTYVTLILKLVAAKATKPEMMCCISPSIINQPTMFTQQDDIMVTTNDYQTIVLPACRAARYPLIVDYVTNTQQNKIDIPFDSEIFKWTTNAISSTEDNVVETDAITIDISKAPQGRLYDCFKLLDYLQICNYEEYLLKCIESVL
ncbi:hypothetical protein E24_00246 [Faustovirus]|nr:hypothetical protein PRJ_Fausto_00231 [Faustovirus]AMN83174.1 hypothetical protein E24_00246 [Faustovirus]AMN84153.1 hypothetical protein D5a_00244 [Faustovirus]AMN85143.1 hypothetical protein E23_00245 [Faustovirus]